jgi:hypothetical protein
MKNGRLYDGNTLDEIWPRQRKAKFYWQQGEPTGVESGGRGTTDDGRRTTDDGRAARDGRR